jgi:alpha-L-fucosidase
MQQRLMDMGRWLKTNGEAVYGTRAWQNAPAITNKTQVYFSTKKNDLFAMVTSLQNSRITVKGVKKPVSVSLLGYKGAVKYTYNNNSVTIDIPMSAAAQNLPPEAWVFQLKNVL